MTGDWSAFGGVVPVLAGSPGAGASVVTAVLADAVQLLAWRVLMVDTADPVRSGLAAAPVSDGPWSAGPHPAVRIRHSWRGSALVARLETTVPVLAPEMVPPPRFWASPVGQPQVTVVDVAADLWRLAANPLDGPGAWLRQGTPCPRPILVVRATRPSLLHAEQVLHRLRVWSAVGLVTMPVALIVVGARRWPPGVVGVAGTHLTPLVDGAVFLPHDKDIAVGGVTGLVTPRRLRDAVLPLLRRWGLAAGVRRLPGVKGALS
ncbi:hypothetical protein F0L68_35600 [Solihabitans fulvus]|uniref:MinD-like ATPase involved in chromosome partitioning or flagellar assembly n=1 Tax=Solihabitans fulvus TaxID=1892852 RepID=A0A5B2WR85_9PSEU|nr:hypothetical protein F0L68_35600 [Solihabitans fulvus]